MAETSSKGENKAGKKELGQPFQTTRTSKYASAEDFKAMGDKLTEVIKAVNANVEASNKRFASIENNQTELTKILGSMRQGNPGMGIGQAAGSMTPTERMAFGLIDTVIKGNQPSPMQQAFQMAASFNKIYMQGQTNMLRTIHVLTKRGKVTDLFEEEEDEKTGEKPQE